MRIRMAGRGVLAAVVAACLAGLGMAAPAMASAAQAGTVRAGTVLANGRDVPGFASGIFPPARSGLGDVSCPTASFCVALGGYEDPLYPFGTVAHPHGHPLAEEWNGHSWRIIPGGLGGAGAVTCTSARFCMAVGGASIEHWNGDRWTAVRTPHGTGDPAGVSCVRTSFCMAVGSDGNGCLTGAVWHGAAWQAISIPGGVCGVAGGLGRVSCTSASNCVAVGGTDGAEHNGIALAVEWNGKTWRVDTPEGNETPSGLSGVSCASRSFCMAVGVKSVNNNDDTDVALAWDGTAWTELSTLPSSAGAVSCASAQNCVAVGGDQAMSWNGSTWTAQAISHPESAGLGALSCWQPSTCMAVGSYSMIALPNPQPDGRGGAHLPLAEEWNGSTWRPLRTPSPGDEQEGLSGVSCRPGANCMAVGAFVSGSDIQTALAERWNGHTWKVLATTDPGPNENALTAVSCAAARQCVAVGYYDVAGDHQALAEQWNGSTWTTLTVPHNGELNGVSCPAINDCVAVGSYPSAGTTQALSATWNGSSWTVQTSPAPGGTLTEFNAVACPNRTRCIAVGDSNFNQGSLEPLTALWNGTAWTVLTTPAPNGGRGWNSLISVSCPGPASCMAVGRTSHTSPLPPALAESWNGTRWTVRPTPGLNIKPRMYLDAVSCPERARCRAVGGYLKSQGTGFMLAEAWNGATWRRLVPLTDPSPTFNNLYAISCPGVRDCIAVGGIDVQRTLAYQWNGTGWRRLSTPNP